MMVMSGFRTSQISDRFVTSLSPQTGYSLGAGRGWVAPQAERLNPPPPSDKSPPPH